MAKWFTSEETVCKRVKALCKHEQTLSLPPGEGQRYIHLHNNRFNRASIGGVDTLADTFEDSNEWNTDVIASGVLLPHTMDVPLSGDRAKGPFDKKRKLGAAHL